MRPTYSFVVVAFPSAISSGIHSSDECISARNAGLLSERGSSLLQGFSHVVDALVHPVGHSIRRTDSGANDSMVHERGSSLLQGFSHVVDASVGHSIRRTGSGANGSVVHERWTRKQPWFSPHAQGTNARATQSHILEPVKLSEFLSNSDPTVMYQAAQTFPQRLIDRSSATGIALKAKDEDVNLSPQAPKDVITQSQSSAADPTKVSEKYVQWFQWGAQVEVCIGMLLLAVGLAMGSLHYAGALEISRTPRSKDDILAEVYATAHSPKQTVAMSSPSTAPGGTGLKGYNRVPRCEQHMPKQLLASSVPPASSTLPNSSRQPLRNSHHDRSSCQII